MENIEIARVLNEHGDLLEIQDENPFRVRVRLHLNGITVLKGVELDAQPQRLDLSDVHLHRARELEVKTVIDSDAHSVDQLRFMRYGVDQARRGWIDKSHVLNTLKWLDFQRWLKRRRA